ncbi:alpha-isopropylmalate synthase regulatory domain-containing protein [Celerinatantimonas sp. YJH-8]|uniref:alpha-isopropylmalate synthase regulatory domain-containing protein n=1 Tax=Celerinatantimonas sp. YJH-8 TaxID=3228714 RepID=UPI0038C2CF1C
MPSPTTIKLLDTTLRDGEQTQGVSYYPEEKVSLGKILLQKLNVDRLEIASARVSDGEKQAVRQLSDWASSQNLLDRIEILGFVDGKLSVDWIRESGARVINLLCKGSEKHCHMQLGKTLQQHLQDISATLDYAIAQGLMCNIYLEDWSNGFRDNQDYVFALIDALQSYPIQHFMLPDTLGIMTPEEVSRDIRAMCQRFPKLNFDFHPHNDYGLATANALAAVKAGARSIHCTINCLGERAGNASLAEVAVVLKDKLHIPLQINEAELNATAKLVENFSGKRIAANTPIVGADVFTQTAGIHADGDQKGNLYVTELTPERFHRERRYALGKLSGKASVLKNLEALNIDLSPDDLSRVLNRIVQLGDMKEVITPEDLPFIIADTLESQQFNYLELLNCSITSGLDIDSVASIKLGYQNQILKSAGSGNGGFDAFIEALKTPLKQIGIALPALVDFEIHIPPGGKTNALTECVIHWSNEQRQTFKTRGVHANQVYAGINATLKMLNILCHQHMNH